jgi:hypothetical protein
MSVISLSPTARLLSLALFALLTACSSASPTPTAPESAAATGLEAASTGLCAAIAALPDAAEAERTFTNEAHEALHSLAGDPGLDRADAARVLEGMEQVETDFSSGADAGVLATDLTALHVSADEALRALQIEVPACAE